MTDNAETETVDVLLVEDDAGDALIVREAFDHYKIRNTLHVVTDGEQALRFVRRDGRVHRRSPSGPDHARPEPAPARRPGGAGRAEGRSRPCG